MNASSPASPPLPPDAPAAMPAPEAPADAAAVPVSAFSLRLNTLDFRDPLRWLALGWRDFTHCPGIGLFFGACFALMGWVLWAVFQRAPAYTLAFSAGFLLVGPFLCVGLYDMSRKLERGERPDLGDALLAWDTRTSTMAIFGGVLLILEMLWARASLVVFAVSFDGMPDFKGSVMALFNPENIAFISAYLAVGGVFAGLIFAVSVVSIPMILDRETDAVTAGLTSLRLVLTQTGVMLWWGALIVGLVVLALLPFFLGLLIVGPVLGHASWHAYRAAVARDDAAA